MIRKVIRIDEEKCDGCGICAEACHEGAIGIVDGKAKLLREDYCDGLGDCLPSCPMGAISFEEREAKPFTCPGEAAKTVERDRHAEEKTEIRRSRLSQWPVQIKLAPVSAPYFNGADLLVAADCTAYAYGNFHDDLIKDRITLIGCPKLDMVDYSDKLTQIFAENDIKSVTVARMEVPCCGGIEYAVDRAVEDSGRSIERDVITVSTGGRILD